METEFDEKQDVAIISNDESMEGTENDADQIRADDFDAIKKKYMPEVPDQEIEDEATHTWEIEDWRALGKKEHGPIFQCAGHPWRVLFFPYGNNVDFASVYLEHGFEDKPSDDWYSCVQFLLILWNPNDPTIYQQHCANHRFTADESDWGFTRFAENKRLFHSPWEEGKDRPLVENDTAKLTAFVRVYKDPTGVLWHNFVNYDSKKETGMVGLKNQGATCYLNSLLQSLYFTTAFRKAVYQIPTENEVEYRENSAYALQRLFYQLQTNPGAVSTLELTGAFGWDSKQIFEQQDVQELSRILMERLEKHMKGTEAADALGRMFVGKMKTYISCINVDYESSRIEDFWDLQLNVSGNKNLDDSFKDYVQVETLDGENQYDAGEGLGHQDAKKGVIFETFPNVLHLQLKRFEYDFQRDVMMKINDRYEFPDVWDASPYLSDDADRSEPYIYHLHGVLVHSGDLNAGHYYAFLKPTKNGDFYKFDDDRVTRATKKEALEENFGGENTPLANGNVQQRNPYTRTWSSKRSMNAYMLVYIRESRLDEILMPNEVVEPPSHLETKFAEEKELLERRRKDKEEAHLYMEVQIASNHNFKAYQGFDIVPWKTETGTPAHPKLYKLLRKSTLADLCEMVGKDLELDPTLIRPWVMVNRQNGTIRPDQPLELPDMTCEEAHTKFGTKTTNTFRIWIESTDEKDETGKPVWPSSKVDLHGVQNNKPVLLFLKSFEPDAQTLLGKGQFCAALHDKVSDLSPQILKLMNWPPGTPIKLFEEIKQNMIEPMKPKSTLYQSEIQDGDIITVQKNLSDKEIAALTAKGHYSEAREYYDWMLNRMKVHFVPKNQPGSVETDFDLMLSKKMLYPQWSVKVAEKLGVDAGYLRFFAANAATGRPKGAVRHTSNQTLGQTLSPNWTGYGPSHNQRPDVLFYEVLEVTLTELETRKGVKVTLVSEGISKEDSYEILVSKIGNVSDLVDGLAKKAGLDQETAQRLRVYEVHAHKIHKVLTADYPVSSLNEYSSFFAEKIPEEEDAADEGDRHVLTFHYDKEPSKPHNVPFVFLVKQGELFKDTKERLSKRIGIKGKQFEKIKFAVVPKGAMYAKPEYLDDDDILYERLASRDDMLALDHMNKTRSVWNRADAIQIR
ncbi:ubiquitin carboxyl-terminal hydrolase-like protein [Eremomyces bilateralis CBS 781.70]|uniref:ubiquitinyl hydrolase 1 n=1 Tax=Eremomyces bilateralis CBS 781.70 TaxID=1392243 RepID=A0A6G1G768_9PEZI|nr:ubiquitin carboxyl-terminal hydrolase-like protein [Eremomyces bilateralis CBS 781.70]KAF1813874.1 ubiquitin carboxyl-terminal hydrolase-like protein [Eremomyces bilateralis CBS 781.70]